MFAGLADSIRGLQHALTVLQEDAPSPDELAAIVKRGNFRPAEDEAIGLWFARFLSVRLDLWAVIDEVLGILDKPLSSFNDDDDLRGFLVGYAAACLLIRADRMLLFDVAGDSVIQRKLNEAFPEYRVPRKQFTKIYSAFVDYRNVFAIRDAMHFANKNRANFAAFRNDAEVGFIVEQLGELEQSLNPGKRRHLKRAIAYLSHKWRRRGVVSAQNVLAAIMEGVGRTASEIAELKHKSVTSDVCASIGAFLQPGDVIITRHAKALTNLFIPGFWPHAAFYIGSRAQVADKSIEIPERVDKFWCDDICVLEARKDGVRLRSLAESLSVDKFVVLRPQVNPDTINKAISRVLVHQGKMYNFDFDFFTSDRVVCTELVYRAYDGLGNLNFPLSERAGRKALSAEELIDFAVQSETFQPVAIFGVDGCRDAVAYGEDVHGLLAASRGSAE